MDKTNNMRAGCLFRQWRSFLGMVPPLWLIALLCASFVLPALFIRASHFEEGTTIALARSIFEDRQWPELSRYGVRLVERPQAISWLLGAFGLLTGDLPIWVVRIPTVVSLIGGALLVHTLARRYVSATAALFGVVCLLASPMVLQKTITAEPDLVLSTTMFSAFVVFWRGHVQGALSTGRWAVIAAILAGTGLLKGPQPLAYFFLGIAAFLILRRRWQDVLSLVGVGLIVAVAVGVWYVLVYQTGDWSIWAGHSRMALLLPGEWLYQSSRFGVFVAIELVPGLLLFAPLACAVLRRSAATEVDVLVVALTCYALVCTLVLVPWPGANGRYAMPATFAVAVGAALAIDRLTDRQRILRHCAAAVTIMLIAYQLVLNWIVMPANPALFRQSAIYGEKVAALAASSGELFVLPEAGDLNVLAYVPYSDSFYWSASAIATDGGPS
jgi:4-amino-4-deoxy-L-arabinose transferase-like glycosyltransferase